MKMHMLVCTLAMLFTHRCCNMIVQTLLPTECKNPTNWLAFGITQRHEMYLKFNVKYLYFAELSAFSYFSLGLRVQI